MNKKTREKRKVERQRIKLWHAYYENCIAADKEKIRGYEQLAKVHSAYIAILLKRLGATIDHKANIKAEEVAEAIDKYVVWATATDNGFELYYSEPMGSVKIEKMQEE